MTGASTIVTPRSTSARRAAVACRINPAITRVGDGMTILTLFSSSCSESNSKMSWVPVPTSIARIRIPGSIQEPDSPSWQQRVRALGSTYPLEAFFLSCMLSHVNAFDQLARFYDWEHEGFLDDLPFYRGLAEQSRRTDSGSRLPIGRLLLPLAGTGYKMVGVDSSRPMLDLAEAKLARDPTLARRVRLVQADLLSLQLDQQFGLVIVALDSFGLFLGENDQLRVSRRSAAVICITIRCSR